jgi:Zn-dependent peptidase ImmA (M78 family)
MNELIEQLVRETGSANPFAIAAARSIAVEYGEWTPVTLGEYDDRSRTITINRRAAADHRIIAAHELGHAILGRDASESDCDRFARLLLRL